ncbi:hypothetical protein [Actinokineospora sp.]|uniref:hypothetical protein n=1 Tax=Actinokineospora sp. TaxID=1872133 RepID=UPI004037E5F7
MRALLVVVVALLLAGCAPPGQPVTLGDRPREVSLVEVGKVADLTFPPEAELLAGWYSYFQEWHLAARVRLPRAALPAFRTTNGLPEPTRASGEFRNPASDADQGWRPADGEVTGVPKATLPDATRSLRFQPGDGDTVVVYLLAADV